MSKKNQPVVLFLVTILVISVFAALPVLSVGENDAEILLVESDDEKMLETLGADIIETYEGHLLVEMDPSEIDQVERMGISVRSIEERTTLYVGGHVFDLTEGEPDIQDGLRCEGYRSGEKGQYIVHMMGPIASEWVPSMEEHGVQVLNYIHNFAYRVRMTPEVAERVSDLYFVDWVGSYHPEYKIMGSPERGIIDVGLVPDADVESITSIRDHADILSIVDIPERGVRLRILVESRETIHELARNRDVSYISEYREPELHSEVDSQIIGGGVWVMDDDNDPSTPYREYGDYGAYINQIGYDGSGVTVAIADTGLGDGTTPDAGHPDFTGRVIGGHGFGTASQWQDGHSHGTHCAGSVGGDTYSGTGVEYAGFGPYYVSQGLAYESELYGIKIFSDGGSFIGPSDNFDILQVAAQNSDSYIHSNSWGGPPGGGQYGQSDSDYDEAVRDSDRDTPDNRPMVITVSAGNDGSGHQTIGSPAGGKNVITVGAAYSYMPDSGDYGYHEGWGTVDNPDQIVSFSSRGWTADNRVKPDVVAPGYGILSTMSPDAGSGSYSPDGRYEWMQGTSMSNPAAAGAAAVTTQWYEINYEETPSPAMVKGLMINTAHDLDDDNGNTGPIPNRDEGWGSVDISKLEYPYEDPVPFYLEDQESVFTESLQEDEHLIMSDREDVPMKFSLVWTDEEAPSGTGSDRTLINDLNLEVESPSGDIYRGNAFSDGWTQAGQDTMGDFDHSGDGWDDTNNVENVYIHPDDVELGLYTVRIVANNIAGDATNSGSNSQDYALIAYNAMEEIPGEGPSVTVNSPDGGEIWEAETFEDITYTATDGDDLIESIDISFSQDNGDSWDPIASGLDNTGVHTWNIPNVHSSECFVRVRAIDEMGRLGEGISSDAFSINGIPPDPPSNLVVEHYGESLEIVYEDDVSQDLGYETGTSGGLVGWDIRDHGSVVGDNSWDWGDGQYDKVGGGAWLISPEITIPADADVDHGVELTFQHWRDIADIWDGVNVKVSIDGSTWELIEDPEPGYDHTIGTGYNNPIEDQPAWGGSVDWEEVSVDLTEYIGETIQIRWDAGVEDFTADGGAGWRIDDILIEALIIDEFGTDHNVVTWDASTDDPDEVSHYQLYRSDDQDGPWDPSTEIDVVEADGSESYEYVDPEKGTADDIYWWYVVRAVGENGLEEENEDVVQEPGEGVPPDITLTSPEAGEQWQAGTQQEIIWTTSDGDDPVESISLWYTTNDGASWNSIESGIGDTGSYTWNVPNEPSTESSIRARATDTVGRWNEDMSDNFEIIGVSPEAPENLAVEHQGDSIQTLFEDDVSEDLGYTTGTSHGEASEWGIRQHGAALGDNSWDFGDGQFNKDSDNGMLSWLITPEITIPAEADPDEGVSLTFQHWYEWGDTEQYDAGNVKISTDGTGGPWTLIVPEDGYDGEVPGTWGNPLGGEEAWGGSSDWTTETFDLTDHIGETIHIRWDAGTEAWDGLEGNGWRIDDIQVQAQIPGGEGDEHNYITWDASPDDPEGVSHYNIYRSEFNSGPWDGTTLIDSVSADGSENYEYIDPDRGMADDIFWWYVVRAVGTNGIEEENEYAVQEPGDELTTMDIDLFAEEDADGWNFVSFNLIPQHTSLETILEDEDHGISGNYEKLMYYDPDDGWQSYIPGRAEHFNELDDLYHTMGIWIKMSQDDTLTIQGSEPVTTHMNLDPGWNMVGMPSQLTGNHDLPEDVSQIGFFDVTQENYLAYDSDTENFSFAPGEAYWIYNGAEQSVVWTIEY